MDRNSFFENMVYSKYRYHSCWRCDYLVLCVFFRIIGRNDSCSNIWAMINYLFTSLSNIYYKDY